MRTFGDDSALSSEIAKKCVKFAVVCYGFLMKCRSLVLMDLHLEAPAQTYTQCTVGQFGGSCGKNF